MCAIHPIAAAGRAKPEMTAAPCHGAAGHRTQGAWTAGHWTPDHTAQAHGAHHYAAHAEHRHGTEGQKAHAQTTGDDGPHRHTVGRAALPAGASLLVRLFAWLGQMRERRRQRLALARLNDAMLKDIGLSAADVEREIERLCWRHFR